MRNAILLIGFILSLLSNNLFAQPLSGILPKHNSLVYSVTPQFSWNSLESATSYQVILAQDQNFTLNVVQSPILTSSSWSSISLSFGNWYWKVVAAAPTGTQESNIYFITIFNPSQVPSLSLWLNGDQGVVLDVNGKVQEWQDQSGNNNNVNQPDINKRPIFQASALGNQPSLQFTGSQFLNGGDILDIGLNSRTMMLVGKMVGINQAFYTKATGGGSAVRYSLIKYGSEFIVIHEDIMQNYISSGFNTDNFSFFRVDSDRLTAKNRFYVNNIQRGPQSNLSVSFDFQSPYRFLVGAYNDNNDIGEVFHLNGNISEMVFFDNCDTVNINKVNRYFRYKYSPPVDLGKDTLLTSFCNYNIIAPMGFSTYLWNTGATSSSISVSGNGTYWVQATDVFGNVSRDTIQVTYPTIPPPTFTGICVNESMIWNADLGPGFTYLWSPNGETTPSISISAAGMYSVQVTDALLCTKNSGDYTFDIDTYSQTTFLGNDTTLCSGNLIGLQVGAAETVSYEWNGITTADQPPFWVVDTTGNYFVETVNGNGCVAQDTMHVTITGTAPLADFDFQNACLNIANVFVDQSVPVGADNIVFWSWNMGDGSPVQNTSTVNYTYAASGTYSVQLYVESIGGCGAFHTESVQVYVNPTANFSIVGHCEDQTVQFTNTSVLGDAALTDYFWDFDTPLSLDNNSIIPMPNRDFDTPGTYDVFFRVTDANGCKDSIVIPLVIDATPNAQFTAANACVNAPIVFTNSSITESFPTYAWDFGDGSNSILTSPSKAYSYDGLFTVQLVVTNANGCQGTVEHPVQIYPNPVASMQIGPSCKGTYMEVMDNSTISSGSIDSSVWVFNTVTTVSGSPAYYLIPALGQQQVELTTYSNEGCAASLSQFVQVNSELQASFEIGSGIVAAGGIVTFNNTSTAGSAALWNFGDGTFSSDFSPEHIYSSSWIDSTLQVYVIAMNLQGCLDTAYGAISVGRPTIDLELTTLYTQKQNDYYIVGVKMTNVGTIELASVKLYLETSKGMLFTETWTGNLAPMESFIYVFDAQANVAVSEGNDEEEFICVSGVGYALNGTEETLLSNNKVCRNIEGEKVILLPVYPNPVSEEMHVQLIVSEKSEVSVTLFDSRGRAVKEIVPQQTLAIGFYNYAIDVTQIQAGTYNVRMKSGKEVTNYKLVILQAQ